jgi:hypothetical protein
MPSNRYLNPHYPKADRLAIRARKTLDLLRAAAGNDQIQELKKLKGILDKRWKGMVRKAEATELMLTPHLTNRERCNQHWETGAVGGVIISPMGISIEGARLARITFLAVDKESEESLAFLTKTFAKNEWREGRAERMLKLLKLREADNVKEYFKGLKENGDFLRLYDIYRSALLLQQQDACAGMVSDYIEKKLRAIVGETDCSCKGCLLREASEHNVATILLFDRAIEKDIFTPRLFGKEKKMASLDDLMDQVFLAARSNGFVMAALGVISHEKPSSELKELFERTMKNISECAEKPHCKPPE